MFPLGYAPNRRGDQAALGVPLTPVNLPATPATWNLAVRITAPGQTYTVDINGGTNPEIRIDWGDGTVENHVSTGLKTHTYQLVKTHTIKLSGRFLTGGNIRLGSNSANRARLVGTSAIPLIPGLAYFRATFLNCTGLTSLPTDLFRYNTAVSASGFRETFNGCTSLTSLPTDLFRYNTAVSASGFYQTFYGCTGLTSLPTDLFRYNTAVSTSGFYQTFRGCTVLTSLPDDLFRYNTAVSASGFYQTFYGCTVLTSLPDDLFRYNTAVSASGFYQTFYGCTKLQQNATIFYADGEQSTRFLNQSVDFTRCFFLTSFSGTTGVAPDLWNCDFGTGTPIKTDCWQGHSVSTVSNFGDIPADWT